MKDDDLLEEKARRLRNRGRRPAIFEHLSVVGSLGWIFVLPLVAFTWLGHTVGRGTGTDWPAIAGVALGLAVSVWLACRQLRLHVPEGP